jgi:hypothetical protein
VIVIEEPSKPLPSLGYYRLLPPVLDKHRHPSEHDDGQLPNNCTFTGSLDRKSFSSHTSTCQGPGIGMGQGLKGMERENERTPNEGSRKYPFAQQQPYVLHLLFRLFILFHSFHLPNIHSVRSHFVGTTTFPLTTSSTALFTHAFSTVPTSLFYFISCIIDYR